eukprot:scaffold1954_cov268-Pinguiococcus_pyrenoidosus.AAC.278
MQGPLLRHDELPHDGQHRGNKNIANAPDEVDNHRDDEGAQKIAVSLLAVVHVVSDQELVVILSSPPDDRGNQRRHAVQIAAGPEVDGVEDQRIPKEHGGDSKRSVRQAEEHLEEALGTSRQDVEEEAQVDHVAEVEEVVAPAPR